MRPNTHTSTIRSTILRITAIPRQIVAYHVWIRTAEPRESTTHLLRHTDTRLIASRSAAVLVRVFDADLAGLAFWVGNAAEAAAGLVGADGLGCGRGLGLCRCRAGHGCDGHCGQWGAGLWELVG